MTESAIVQAGKLRLNVDIQNALVNEADAVPEDQLTLWANLAYDKVAALSSDSVRDDEMDVTIRLVEESEITQLNRDYRGKDKATNVLSFPFENELLDLDLDVDMSDEWGVNLLGDLVICHSVIVKEAGEQEKSVADHYAHMIVHGVLHLCGYDHLDDPSAEEMEGIEVSVLAQKQIANPYL